MATEAAPEGFLLSNQQPVLPTSFQPGVLYHQQMNPGPASDPVSPDVGHPLVRAWRAQRTQHYSNNHHGASDLSQPT